MGVSNGLLIPVYFLLSLSIVGGRRLHEFACQAGTSRQGASLNFASSIRCIQGVQACPGFRAEAAW